ncbi:MAG: hypothetical protein FJ098_12135, partial [Deltaproteobacteria bacterium]|nr:hypothetical protein [Deltaproteobacteria bacterium]
PGGVCCDRACDGGCVTCGGSWETRTVDIDGDLAGADDFDPLVHRLGIGEGGVGYYLTWDDQYLYAAWTGPVDTAHAVYLALDANPDPAADQGAGGVIGGLVFPGDRKPEYAVAFTESDGIWLTLAAGGNWVSPAQDVCTVLSCWSHYAGLPGNPTWELRIPRASIPLVDPDAGFAVWMWSTGKPGGQVWSAWPPATGNGPVVSGPDAQFVVAGPGMCRNRTINTDPAGACAGSCRTCDGAGACMDAVAGTDPEDQCTAADPLSCGLTGACAAGGGCAWWPGTTPCAGATCAGSVRLAASFCSGVAPGACVPSGSEDCYPHACVVDACVDPCTDNAHCLGPHYCNDRPLNGPATGACEPLLADGFFCDETSDCAHGHCVQIGDAGMGPDVGVCCATACDGACEDCLTGACVPRADGTDPGGECGGCEVCDGAGGCRAVDPGADPDPDPKAFCAQTPLPVPPTVWSCGLSGRCDGLGGCEPWHSGETCHTAQCEACQISALADTCAADGTCTDHGAGAICAGGLACRTSTACYATCALDTHCCGVTAPQLCHASLACSPCTDQPVCPTNGADCCGSDSCADERDLPSLLGSYVIRTSTQGARNEFSHGGMGAVAPDRVFRLVTGAAPVQLVAAVSGTKTGGAAVDTYLFLRVGDCATGAVIAANDDCGGNPAAGSCLTAILAPSSVFHLVLDGRGASTDRGDLALSVTLSTYCGNGTCDPGETCGGCADCSPCCGDGSCDLLSGENGCTCPGDCNGALGSDNACGDGCCSAWDCGALCAADCNLCTGCGFCTVPQGALETQTPLG